MKAFSDFKNQCRRQKRTPEEWARIIKRALKKQNDRAYAAGVVAFHFSSDASDWSAIWDMSRENIGCFCPSLTTCGRILRAIFPEPAAVELCAHLAKMASKYSNTHFAEAR